MVRKTWRETPGPWLKEPIERSGYSHDLQCIAIRNLLTGHWCGYVVIPLGMRIEASRLEVHGGVTYDREGVPGWPKYDQNRVIGFDCAHYMDVIPSNVALGLSTEFGTYRDVWYVTGQMESLAEQIAAQIKARAELCS